MYKNWAQIYDPEICEKYLIHDSDTHLCFAHHLQQCADYRMAINATD